LFIVLELATGGELFKKIYDHGPYNEDDGRRAFTELLNAVHYLHCQGIAHRDLKPENILLTEEGSIKIWDVGLATMLDKMSLMTTLCGTPQYLAPEIIKIGLKESNNMEGYDKAVDMWSLGVILYIILSGAQPFDFEEKTELFKHISSGQFSFDEEIWDKVSNDARDLIRNLLEVDPNLRITAENALSHPWILVNSTEEDETSIENNPTSEINPRKRKLSISYNNKENIITKKKENYKYLVKNTVFYNLIRYPHHTWWEPILKEALENT